MLTLKTFFIADTHFGHGDIIEYEKRPFGSVDEMDREMITRWNSVVSDDDTVYVVGDFSFYDVSGDCAKTAAICSQLKGKKILIKGNHDIHSEEYYRNCGFAAAYDYPIILGGFWIISHEPMYINANMPYANIYGHVHSNEIYRDYSSRSFCACAERINYTPVEWDEIKKRMQNFNKT